MMIVTNKETTLLLLINLLLNLGLSTRGAVLECYTFGSFGKLCNVKSNDTNLVREGIIFESTGSFSVFQLSIQAEAEGVTLNISLGSGVRTFEVDNTVEATAYIITDTINSNLIKFRLKGGPIAINDEKFFKYFPNLEIFYATYFSCEFIPNFTENMKLIDIDVGKAIIENTMSRIINQTMVRGLDKLKYLRWRNSGITEIRPGSFEGLSSLDWLDLAKNNIKALESCTFEGLSNVNNIFLQDNDITSVDPNAFLGLEKASLLSLANNPDATLDPITSMKNLVYIDLSENNPQSISPGILQQLPKLKKIRIQHTRFNCSCDLEWISKLNSFDIIVGFGVSSCIHDSSQQVDDATLYANCSNLSYQCFNKSIECKGDHWWKVDNNNSCDCIYPDVTYNSSVICSDIDECESLNGNCSHNCTNIPGSYYCSCLPGYAMEGSTDCTDVNECESMNGNCSHNCTNFPGSFSCSCLPGFMSEGTTNCSDINECIFSNGNCSHNCKNIPGSYYCSCFPGYVMEGTTDCTDINECESMNGNCFHNCTNTMGSYECSCLPEYVNQGFSGCKQVDACSVNNGGCQHICSTITDGHSCDCFEGYKIDSTNSSHCESNLGGETDGQGENISNLRNVMFYLILFLAMAFLITIIVLFIILIVVYFYFRKQLRYLKTPPANTVDNIYTKPTTAVEHKGEVTDLDNPEIGMTFKNSIEETPV